MPPSIEELTEALARRAYLADRGLATVLHVALALRKPLLLEGEAGVGKTEVAKALADALGARLIRLQCYEGIDVASALYDWSYARQMLYIRTLEVGGNADVREARAGGLRPRLPGAPPAARRDRARRPGAAACCWSTRSTAPTTSSRPSCSSCSPTSRSRSPRSAPSAPSERPIVVLTSNRTRELHDALKRRCLYHWIGHPSLEREIAIVRARVPGVPERLAARPPPSCTSCARSTSRRRRASPRRSTGRRRSSRSASASSTPGIVDATLGSVLKYHEDLERVRDRGLAAAASPRRARTAAHRDAVSEPRPGDALVRKLVTFGRILREAGLEVGPRRVQDALLCARRPST